MPDTIVYAHADGRTYVACFDGEDDEPQWLRWPAEGGGWAQRRSCSPDDVDPDRVYDAVHARLALRLSGAPHDATGG